MKPFGTWGTVSSYSAGGVIGSLAGILTLASGAFTLGVGPLLVLGGAIVLGVVAGYAINVWNRGVGDFDKEIKKAPNAKLKTRTVAEKVLTGAAVTGYVALLVVAASDVAITPVEVTPIVSEVVEVAPIASETVIEPSKAPNTETPVPTPDRYGCDNPQLTPEEKSNCGKHSYAFAGHNIIDAVNQSNRPCQSSDSSSIKIVSFYFDEEMFAKRESANTYLMDNLSSSDSILKQYYIFTMNGLIYHREYRQLKQTYYCVDETTWTIIP